MPLSIATSSHRKKRLFWPSLGEGGERAWQGSPHHFQEEEKASKPQFCHQSSARQGSSSLVPAKSGVEWKLLQGLLTKRCMFSWGSPVAAPGRRVGMCSSRCFLPVPLHRSSPGTAPSLGSSSGQTRPVHPPGRERLAPAPAPASRLGNAQDAANSLLGSARLRAELPGDALRAER